MNGSWKPKIDIPTSLLVWLYLQNFTFGLSQNDEGVALPRFKEKVVNDPCSRNGVWCVGGYVLPLKSWETRELIGRKLLQDTRRPLRRGWRFVPPPLPDSSQSLLPSSPTPSASPVSRNSPPRQRIIRSFSSPPLLPASPTPSPSSIPFIYPPSPIARIPPPSSSNPIENFGEPTDSSNKRNHQLLILYPAIGVPLVLLLLIVGFFYFRRGKVATVNPWATGLSGPLRRAFTTGVPKLKKSELEAACEDFSNVIGSSSVFILYKGTLSSGVEIAVASVTQPTSKDWTQNMEAQFRNKIEKLSRVNHKNFVNLLGYCEEDEPFTRMMVFEYAPNGTLFEHIHIREAEHLDWNTRMRIAMGIAYCVQHIHQLAPPMAHMNLNSSSVYLTEDYAAKLADFVICNEGDAAQTDSIRASNVSSIGGIILEMITGKATFSGLSGNFLHDWVLDYLRGVSSLKDIVDPTLKTYQEDQLQLIDELIKSCINLDYRKRPVINEVCTKLRELTGIEPVRAIPQSSHLWWAELEIMNTEAN